MKLFVLCSLCFLLFACGSTKNVTSEEQTEPAHDVATFGDVTQQSDPVTVLNATINGNILSIEVSYSGGCQDHEFNLTGSIAIMKSLPPKRAIKLMHNSNEETCRELITETLTYDIRKFAATETSGSEIILLLDGYKEPLRYIYP